MITALILLYVALVCYIISGVFGVFEKNNPKPQPNPEPLKDQLPEYITKRGYIIEVRWQIKEGHRAGLWVDWYKALNKKVYANSKAANEALLSAGAYMPHLYEYRITPVYTQTELGEKQPPKTHTKLDMEFAYNKGYNFGSAGGSGYSVDKNIENMFKYIESVRGQNSTII